MSNKDTMNQEQDDIAIQVSNLSKCYQIYNTPRDRLKQFILPRIQHAVGRQPAQYFREFWALKDVSFEVRKGETIGIIGLNGSGKSTLLKLICGTLAESLGEIKTKGRIAALLELGTGFNPEFTGRENIYQNASILGLSEQEIDEKYDDIVGFADIGDFIDRPVKTYSSGMYVRLAFAVMVNVDPDILVIDEALAVGDAIFTQKCMRFLREFKQRGTLLFVSHNMGAVVNLCDRAVWLEKGKLTSIGTAKYVCEQYLARRYLSSHQRNRIKTRVSINNECEKSTEYIEVDLKKQRDIRTAFLDSAGLRNNIRIFDLDEIKRSFGNSGAEIIYAAMEDLKGNCLSWITGGETAKIVIRAKIYVESENLIVGFNIKDKLGQVLIGQNTYLDTCLSPVRAAPNDLVESVFVFQLPIFPRGTYVVDVAIASGTPPDVVQLQWMHEAFLLESQTSSVVSGLIGLAFDQIDLRNKGSIKIHEC